jgi:hypothetical protein
VLWESRVCCRCVAAARYWQVSLTAMSVAVALLQAIDVSRLKKLLDDANGRRRASTSNAMLKAQVVAVRAVAAGHAYLRGCALSGEVAVVFFALLPQLWHSLLFTRACRPSSGANL